MIKDFSAKNILLLGLAAVIVLGGVVYFEKKSSVTSTKNSYRNDYLNFEISTLPDHVKSNNSPSDNSSAWFMDDRLPVKGLSPSQVMVIYINDKDICKEQGALNAKTISLGGKQAEYAEFVNNVEGAYDLSVCLPYGSKFFYLFGAEQNSYTSDQKQIVAQDFNQILSIFKFTDATANWKTYSNTKYGFSIKYPQKWVLDEINTAYIEFINPDYQNPKTQEGYFPNVQIQINQYDLSTGYKENSMIDGVKAYRTSAPSGMQAAIEGMEFKKDANRYQIYLQYDDGKVMKGVYDSGIYNKEAVNIFNQMISTFKFTQ